MDIYDILLLALTAGTLACFWRAWRSGEIHDIAVVLRRRLEQGMIREL